MSAIAGIYHPGVPKPVDPARVRAMTAALAHRGPAGGEVWTAPGVGLGHRHRSPALEQAQPFLARNGRIAVTCDGSILNAPALRAELEAQGHVFPAGCDTELIAAAWRVWGAECLPRLAGEFAFALYDADLDALLLVRDRLGVKPLFLTQLSDGSLIFASELRGLLAHPLMRRTPCPRGVEAYLAHGHVPDGVSILAGVTKLPAGHYILVRRARHLPDPVRWWNVDPGAISAAPPADLAGQLAALMREAVRSRTDVGTGVMLGNHPDGAAIVALMAERSRVAVATCAVGMDGVDGGTLAQARKLAARFATSHRTRPIMTEDAPDLDRLVDALEEPVADAYALIALHVSELAAGTMTSALAGCGDGVRDPDRDRSGGQERAGWRRWLGEASALWSDIRQLVPAFAGSAHARTSSLMSAETRARLQTAEFRRILQADDSHSLPLAEESQAGPSAGLLAAIDRTGMANGLEVRLPLLDHRIVEFVARLPAPMRDGVRPGRQLVARALHAHLPADMLRRPPPGDALPVGAWLRGPLSEAASAMGRGSAIAELGWIDAGVVAVLAAEHRAGRRGHGRLLWQLLMLERALQRMFGLGSSPSYSASTKYSPSGGALKPSAARSRA